MAELKRPATGRIIGGVCAAIANRFGWNVTVVRILTVLSVFIPGPQVVAYIVCWIVIPSEQRATSTIHAA
jgi:phage shock protein C